MRIRTKICEIFTEMSKKLNNNFHDKKTICEICGKSLNEIMEIIDRYEEEEYKVNILDFLLAECHKEMIAKPTATTTKCKHYSSKEELKQLEQFSVSGKKKGKKR